MVAARTKLTELILLLVGLGLIMGGSAGEIRAGGGDEGVSGFPSYNDECEDGSDSCDDDDDDDDDSSAGARYVIGTPLDDLGATWPSDEASLSTESAGIRFDGLNLADVRQIGEILAVGPNAVASATGKATPVDILAAETGLLVRGDIVVQTGMHDVWVQAAPHEHGFLVVLIGEGRENASGILDTFENLAYAAVVPLPAGEFNVEDMQRMAQNVFGAEDLQVVLGVVPASADVREVSLTKFSLTGAHQFQAGVIEF